MNSTSLSSLITRQSSAWMDTRDTVELAKDVGAMQIDGGFIVIEAIVVV